ncbi:malto-oligosyltrehalose trehalohydrolase [Anditalea andensis]|uniref:Malto-oligosyltrehalose trehalohydrolase n=1 Tax=Anditalea andensis TaxID=1048983 RepID=A0A074LDU2_9BACT|nr:malto-oligosyltrehalose trehalohydrolase [Anditalea andensis]
MTKPVGALKGADNNYHFTLWSPHADNVQVIIKGEEAARTMERDAYGYWHSNDGNGVTAGSKYKFLLNGEHKLPDPASMSQPDGVHEWSEVVDHDFDWTDENWQPAPLSDLIIYELHVGTFTEKGTFEAIIDRIDHLQALGINAIEIMPIAQFPGSRNWGYDGVYPFAAQNSYGGVSKLKMLVDKFHQAGIAVILDVVYNHMGPEGNYLSLFGPYFTEKYNTPWGAALNFDDSYSDHIRNFFLQNALMWLKEFHIDGLRLDAVHAIMDNGPVHLLKELSLKVDGLEKETGKPYILIAESDMNDVKVISDYSKGGYGLEAQWTDDFHHAVHTLITGELDGYYSDYGQIAHLAKSFKQGFIYDGIYSNFRNKLVGTDPSNNASHQFVVCIQNHDQVGNRMTGDRLPSIVSYEKLKLAAGTMLISPFVPMLFMGEEYGEDQPFQYFVHHGDPALVKAVQEGRSKEFDSFKWQGEVPDPQSENTFRNSKLNWDFKSQQEKDTLFKFYKYLIHLRKEGAFDLFKSQEIITEVMEDKKLLKIAATDSSRHILVLLNFSDSIQNVTISGEHRVWHKLFASSDQQWQGPAELPESVTSGNKLPLSPNSISVYY